MSQITPISTSSSTSPEGRNLEQPQVPRRTATGAFQGSSITRVASSLAGVARAAGNMGSRISRALTYTSAGASIAPSIEEVSLSSSNQTATATENLKNILLQSHHVRWELGKLIRSAIKLLPTQPYEVSSDGLHQVSFSSHQEYELALTINNARNLLKRLNDTYKTFQTSNRKSIDPLHETDREQRNTSLRAFSILIDEATPIIAKLQLLALPRAEVAVIENTEIPTATIAPVQTPSSNTPTATRIQR